LTQATTKPVPCQVRSRTQSPCLHRAVVEILGIPFCEACAREQEAYFAIGELTQEIRGPNRMGHMSQDARALIRAAREVHAERHGAQTFLPGTRLSFLDAAERTGIRSDRQCYYDVIDDLEYEGAIEWDQSARYARGDKHYLITQRGLNDLGSA
jgi:hypothetical protein